MMYALRFRNLMNFSRHQRQHLKQHMMQRATGFWATGGQRLGCQGPDTGPESPSPGAQLLSGAPLAPDLRSPLSLWSMYSKMTRTICTSVRMRAPKASDPVW